MGVLEDIRNGVLKPRTVKREGEALRGEKPGAVDPGANTPGTVAAQQPVTSFSEMVSRISPYRPKTEQQQKKQERQRKAEAAISAFGDGASSIVNLVGAAKGAPNVKREPSSMLSERSRAKWEQLRQEHLDNRDKYYNQMMRAMQLDESTRKNDEYIQRQQRIQARADRDQERKERLADAQTSRMQAQVSKDEASKAYWETRARLLEEGYPIEKALKEAKIAESNARARLNNAKADVGGFAPKKAGSGTSGHSGKGGKYVVYDEEGNPHYYDNATMYKQGVEQYGSHLKQTEEYTTTDQYGDRKVAERKRSTDSKAGELARKAEEKRKAAAASKKAEEKRKAAPTKAAAANKAAVNKGTGKTSTTPTAKQGKGNKGKIVVNW